jgi:hypothetical protein
MTTWKLTRLCLLALWFAGALMGISVSGWGLILLGLALAFEVGAVILSPDELQKWVARSYFGTGVGTDGLPKFDKGDWAAEKAALDKLMAPPDKKDAEGKAA